jgi:hypothetical protein
MHLMRLGQRVRNAERWVEPTGCRPYWPCGRFVGSCEHPSFFLTSAGYIGGWPVIELPGDGAQASDQPRTRPHR